jgi:gamma-glutamylputrescine oxidase
MTSSTGQVADWYADTAAGMRQWPALAFDLDIDVCVIGGGLAGLTVAREAAKRGWSVALIEANRIAGSASGRNTGFVRPGFGRSAHRLVERCGLDNARALWALSEEGVAYVRNSILGLAMPGVDAVDGWLDVSTHDNADDLMPTVTLLGQDLGVEVEGWPVERVREALKSNCYFHALHFPQAFSIHPVNYALGLAADAERRGARLFEQTVALEVDPVGVRKRISTTSAKIRANQVVLAGNVEIGRLAPQLAATILPVTTYVAVTQPIPSLADAIAFRGAVSDSGNLDDQYRVIDADRLMWRSGATTWVGDARRHAANIKAAIERIYPQLRSVEIAQAWSGTMGVSVHGMPQIGEVAPGLWVANAFGGHGINTSAIGGVLIARAMIEHDDTWRLFLPYDLVWAGGALGRAVLQGSYWARRIKDKARARAGRKQNSNAGSLAAAAGRDAPGP